MTSTEEQLGSRVATGVTGFDDILGGGFPRHRMYLIEGSPGVGKTTLALQFLLDGVRRGERCLYVTLSETREELDAVAESHGWSIEGLDVYEVSSGETSLDGDSENTLYVPAEVELGERMKALLAEVDRVKPARIVVDSCTELRLLAQSPLRFRRQLLALKEDLVRRRCTILLIENPTQTEDPLLQSLVHGVVHLEQLSPLYGAERRRLRVVKMREVKFRGGYHDFVLRREGVVLFPRLIASEHHDPFEEGSVPSGVPQIDAILGGGLDRGTATLFMGAAGTGKSALAAQYAVAAARRGERAAMFIFDESLRTLLGRSSGLGMDLRPHLDSGVMRVQQIDPAEMAPGEFVGIVRQTVEEWGARLLVIDSLNGYLQAMPEEKFLIAQLHELLSYLRQRGVAVIMVVAQAGLIGSMVSPVDVSYLADTVVLTRFFEARGRVLKAISVLKKRSGRHEDTIREFQLGPNGFTVSAPLAGFHGVLTGIPQVEAAEPLAQDERE
jgi:circadian clock protein KaiC